MKYHKLTAPELIKTLPEGFGTVPDAFYPHALMSLWTDSEMRPEWPSDAFTTVYIPQDGTYRDAYGFRREHNTAFIRPARPGHYVIVQLMDKGYIAFTTGGNSSVEAQITRARKWADLNNITYDSAVIHCKSVRKNGTHSDALYTLSQSFRNGLVVKERIES